MQIRKVGQYKAKWGEGPVFWQNFLFYADIEGRQIVRLDLKTETEQFYPVGQRVGVVAPTTKGDLLWAGDHGIYLLDLETGESLLIGDPESHLPNHRFNDGKCSPDGYFFTGTISLEKVLGSASLYRLSPDGQIDAVLHDVTNSNGMAWSLDGKVVYYIDTPRREIWAFDYLDGQWLNRRTVINTGLIDASPDGMTIDREGKLWVAFCHGACVVQFCPESGELLRKIDLPCLETTSLCFGGANLEKLYVTTGLHAKIEETGAGWIYEISGFGARGLEVALFNDQII